MTGPRLGDSATARSRVVLAAFGNFGREKCVRSACAPAGRAPSELPMRTRFTIFVLACLGFSCSSRLPRPPYTNQPTSALVEVEFPPPPARVEFVPPRPADDAVWITGEWLWEGRKWAWKPGAWVMPPQDAKYARWVMVRRGDGKLFFAPGAWRNGSGEEVTLDVRHLTEARSRSGVVVNPEGENEPTAPDVTADGGE
jgi:hypothetical protein